LLSEILRLLLSRKPLLHELGPIRLLRIRSRAKMKRIGFKRGLQPPLVSLIRVAPSTQLCRRPRIAFGGALRNPCTESIRGLRLARLLRGHFERTQLYDGGGDSLGQQYLLGGPWLRRCADFLFALVQPGEGLLLGLSSLRSNAFADCSLLISVLIVFKQEGFSVLESLLSSFVASRLITNSSTSGVYRERLKRCRGFPPGTEKKFGRLTILLTSKIMTEYIGCFHADGVVDCEEGVPARFPLLDAEMIFRKQCMQRFP
jgi:hypothetical protein